MPPLGMVLLVATRGDAGLPLGMLAGLGTGEARFGGAEGVPFAVVAADLWLVCLEMWTLVTAMSVRMGEMTWPASAVPIAGTVTTLLASVLVVVDREDTDVLRINMLAMPVLSE